MLVLFCVSIFLVSCESNAYYVPDIDIVTDGIKKEHKQGLNQSLTVTVKNNGDDAAGNVYVLVDFYDGRNLIKSISILVGNLIWPEELVTVQHLLPTIQYSHYKLHLSYYDANLVAE